jgi:hypothetical protein
LSDNQGRNPEGSSAASIPLTRGEPAMRHSLSVLVFSLATVFAITLSASACINDREVNAKEREFKSQYQESNPSSAPAPSYTPSTQDKLVPFAALGTGSVLLTGAGVFCLKRK